MLHLADVNVAAYSRELLLQPGCVMRGDVQRLSVSDPPQQPQFREHLTRQLLRMLKLTTVVAGTKNLDLAGI